MDFVLHWVFDRQDLARGFVENGEHGGKRRGLAAPGRAGDHDHAVRQRQQAGDCGLIRARHAELADVEQPAVLGQQPNHGRFTMLGGHRGHANIDFAARDAQARSPILRQPALGDVEAGENLDAGNDRLRQCAGRCRNDAQQAVHSHSHDEPGLERLDMDVGRAQLDRAFQKVVDRAHDRRATGEITQALDVIVGARERGGFGEGSFFLEPRAEHGRDVLKRGDLDVERHAEHDFRRAHRGGVGRIAEHEPRASLCRLIGENRGLAEKALGKSVGERISGH